MEIQADDFLEHYGVKGMRWGKRKAKDESGSQQIGGRKPHIARSGGQKLLIAGGAYGAYSIGSAFVMSKMLKGMGNVTEENMVAKMGAAGLAGTAAGIGAGVMAVKYTRRLIDKHNQKKVSELTQKPKGLDMSDDEVKAQVAAFLKDNPDF